MFFKYLLLNRKIWNKNEDIMKIHTQSIAAAKLRETSLLLEPRVNVVERTFTPEKNLFIKILKYSVSG